MTQASPSQSKADRTRRRILDAAEQQFAARGFGETRLEDVARAAEIKRSAIFYHFADKRALYQAVLDDALGWMDERTGVPLLRSGPVVARIEASMEIWVDCLAKRPTLAHLLLREAADGGSRGIGGVGVGLSERMKLFGQLMSEGKQSGELDPVHDGPGPLFSIITGASVFYVAAMARLAPMGFDPLEPAQLEALERDLLLTTGHLLGIKPSQRGSDSNGPRLRPVRAQDAG